MDSIKLHTFLTSIAVPGSWRLVIAYSGGLDSHVLLNLCVELRAAHPEFELVALHIDHGISNNAKLWSQHCQAICKKLKVKYILKKVKAKKNPLSGHSQEALARDLRYQAFAKLIHKGDLLLTAHHADDQVETLLLQLFRGAGPKGLAAMPEVAQFGDGYLVRPLLSHTRQEIHSYAHQNKLYWVDDESNLDTDIDRNYIRHGILPMIKQRWPGVLETMGRTSKLCAEASDLLSELAAIDYEQVKTGEKLLSCKKLLMLKPDRQRNLLRYWLHTQNFPIPSYVKLRQVEKDILHSNHDASPVVDWHGVEVRRYGDDIYVMQPLTPVDSNQVIEWSNVNEPLELPFGLGTIKFPRRLSPKQIKPLHGRVTVRFRQGGERIKLPGRKGTHELKKLFQEWRIPPWQRDRIPLIFVGEKLIEVVSWKRDC